MINGLNFIYKSPYFYVHSKNMYQKYPPGMENPKYNVHYTHNSGIIPLPREEELCRMQLSIYFYVQPFKANLESLDGSIIGV